MAVQDEPACDREGTVMGNPAERLHGIGSYNKGCRCESCREASRRVRARHRRAKNLKDPTRTVVCSWCGDKFVKESAMKQHRTQAHDWI